jgi:hypothetical protein
LKSPLFRFFHGLVEILVNGILTGKSIFFGIALSYFLLLGFNEQVV